MDRKNSFLKKCWWVPFVASVCVGMGVLLQTAAVAAEPLMLVEEGAPK